MFGLFQKGSSKPSDGLEREAGLSPDGAEHQDQQLTWCGDVIWQGRKHFEELQNVLLQQAGPEDGPRVV